MSTVIAPPLLDPSSKAYMEGHKASAVSATQLTAALTIHLLIQVAVKHIQIHFICKARSIAEIRANPTLPIASKLRQYVGSHSQFAFAVCAPGIDCNMPN